MPWSERRQEINARPESGGYPKGDAVVVDTDWDSEFYQALAQGVDTSSRHFDRDSEFNQATVQGIDTSSRHFDRDSEHDSEHESI